MPAIEIVFYREGNSAPVLDWLTALKTQDRRAYAKCVAHIRLLAQLGHELRRPLADYLEQGIHELRIRRRRVNYRILYFLHGRAIGVLVHAFAKEDQIPEADVVRAIERKRRFEENPDRHRYEGDVEHG